MHIVKDEHFGGQKPVYTSLPRDENLLPALRFKLMSGGYLTSFVSNPILLPQSAVISATRAAAEWLDRQPQLQRDVFARGGVAARASSQGRTCDITDLFRACLVALRVPEQVDAYQLRFITLWRVPDAIARITRMLATEPAGGALATFLPGVDDRGVDKELRCRAAVASNFFGGLELAREGTLALQQDQPWLDIELRPV